MSKKSLHRRNDSGELDVFEAAKYFADANEHRTHYEPWRGGRKSLDMAISFRRSLILPPEMEKPRAVQKESKKPKQPSSPGGRLASFLNSLFNQTKKKSKSKSGKEDEDESPGGMRRRRRSSISHFYSIRSSTTNNTAPSNANMAPANNRTIRTPPPMKSYRSYKDLKVHGAEKINGVSQSCKLTSMKSISNGEDDDGDSDSSSDLFDLPNSDLLDFYSSSGLPVYETTKMDSIKRGSAPISTAAI